LYFLLLIRVSLNNFVPNYLLVEGPPAAVKEQKVTITVADIPPPALFATEQEEEDDNRVQPQPDYEGKKLFWVFYEIVQLSTVKANLLADSTWSGLLS
jgi:hypothetical protein